MAYLDHIHRCNAHELGKFRPWSIGGRTVGWLHLDFIEHLRAFPAVFSIGDDRIALADSLATPAQRNTAIAGLSRALAADGVLAPERGELFPVAPVWGMEPLAEVDRQRSYLSHPGR